MIENSGLERRTGVPAANLVHQPRVFLPDLGALILLLQVAFSIERLKTKRFLHSLLFLLELPGCLRLLRQRAFLQLGIHGVEQIFRDKLFDNFPLEIHDAIDAEIEK